MKGSSKRANLNSQFKRCHVTFLDLYRKGHSVGAGTKYDNSSVNLELTSSPGHPNEIKRLH